MKLLCLVLVVLGPLLAQPNAGATLLYWGEDFHYLPKRDDILRAVVAEYQYSWAIYRNPDHSKSMFFVAYLCDYWAPKDAEECKQLSRGDAQDLGPVAAGLITYYSLDSTPKDPPKYGEFLAQPTSTLLQPAAPVAPRMIFLDGLSYNLVEFDLTTFAMISSVTLPPQARAFGIRPTPSGPANEVWTAHAGTINEISISDLGAQTVLATIPTPSLDPNISNPVGLVFTNSGLTALYAVDYYTPDSAGNNGVLLAFDVETRKLRSALPLKYAPTALVMGPDGLTAYVLSDLGMITYYDILSATADLSVSTYTPGINGGYSPPDQVFIHPDGTRLFWNYGFNLVVFDLLTHKIVHQFNSGLAGGALASMQMSQDGSTMWFTDTMGNVVIVETRTGAVVGAYQGLPFSSVYPGPAY